MGVFTDFVGVSVERFFPNNAAIVAHFDGD